MTARRGSGEGSVYRTGDGRWRGAVDLGWEAGKRRRKWISGKTRQETVRKMREAQRLAERGVVADDRLTVAAWLENWLETVVDGRSGTANTRAHYRQIVRQHLRPALGTIRLDKLTPEQVDKFLAGKAADGLSRTYISRMRSTLADALRHAERRGLVSRNAAGLSVMPRTKDRIPRRSLTPDEARRLLDAASGERFEALIVVGLTVGLRPGELAGLRWPDLNLEAEPATLTVSGAAKRQPDGSVILGDVKRSTAGHRTVALPHLAGSALRDHRRRQAAERLAAGPLWKDQGLVFCSEIGTLLDPSKLRRRFGKVAEKAALSDVSFLYALRHSAVSLLIDAGATIEEVADLVGDDPRTIYRHYRHRVQPVAQAATAMEAVLRA